MKGAYYLIHLDSSGKLDEVDKNKGGSHMKIWHLVTDYWLITVDK